MKPVISLIISTYNRPSALNLVLQSVLLQKVICDEVVIADDGSSTETKLVVDAFAINFKSGVKHVWHEDKGYRLGGIRNKAILQASGNYIIQIDGDCILHPFFIDDHKRLAKAGTFIYGTRSLLGNEFTQQLMHHGKLDFPLNPGKQLFKKINSIHSRTLSKFFYKMQQSKNNYKYVKGCNMAFWKKDLMSVNGYNEEMEGWGKEDNELALRLLNSGLQIRTAKFSAIQYHLFHKENSRSELTKNESILQQTKTSGLTHIPNGIMKSTL